jgi:hypothetical protein
MPDNTTLGSAPMRLTREQHERLIRALERSTRNGHVGGVDSLDSWIAQNPRVVEGENGRDAVHLNGGDEPRVIRRFAGNLMLNYQTLPGRVYSGLSRTSRGSKGEARGEKLSRCAYLTGISMIV